MIWVYVLIYLLGVLPIARYAFHNLDAGVGWSVLMGGTWPIFLTFNFVKWYVTKPTKAQIAAKKQKEAEEVTKEFELHLFDGKTPELRALEKKTHDQDKEIKRLTQLLDMWRRPLDY